MKFLLILIVFAIIAVQDVLQRAVTTLALVAVIPIVFYYQYAQLGILELQLWYSGFNLCIIGVLIGILFLWFTLLQKRDFKEMIGTGDILLMIALCFAFEPLFFATQLALSFIFSLIAHLIFSRFQKEKNIPLAGYMSIYFSVIYISIHFNIIKHAFLN